MVTCRTCYFQWQVPCYTSDCVSSPRHHHILYLPCHNFYSPPLHSIPRPHYQLHLLLFIISRTVNVSTQGDFALWREEVMIRKEWGKLMCSLKKKNWCWALCHIHREVAFAPRDENWTHDLSIFTAVVTSERYNTELLDTPFSRPVIGWLFFCVF